MHSRNRVGRGFSFWSWPRFQRVAAQYSTSGRLYAGDKAAYEAGRRNGWLDKYYGPKALRRAKHYGHWEKVERLENAIDH